jgi:hypothetical protein
MDPFVLVQPDPGSDILSVATMVLNEMSDNKAVTSMELRENLSYNMHEKKYRKQIEQFQQFYKHLADSMSW